MSDSSLRGELQAIKRSMQILLERIEHFERKLDIRSRQIQMQESEQARIPPAASVSAQVREERAAAAPAELEEAKAPAGKKDIEMDMGKFWLNRIGILIFTLGVAFLISYTFRYFGPMAKILFGYLICAGLFFFGTKLEKKENFIQFGRVLLAGGWAITYFTTYAMYHFEASRIITSQLLDLACLAAVAAGMITHSLRYKSEELSALAIFIGYITATLGDVNYFTFLSCVFLAVAVMVLVYKMQWIRIIFVGLALTYLTHYIWVLRHIYSSVVPVGHLTARQVYGLTDLSLLALYWAIFTAGIHMIRNLSDARIRDKLSAANFCNAGLFFFMAYPQICLLYPQSKFISVFCLGLVYLALAWFTEKFRQDKLFISNVLAGLSLLTLAVPLKFMGFHTTVIWLVELPFLLFMGLAFDRRVIRYFSFALAIVLFCKIILYDFSLERFVTILGFSWQWDNFISLLAVFSLGLCFYLNRYLKNAVLSSFEHSMTNVYSGMAIFFATKFLWLVVDAQYLTLILMFECLCVSGWGFFANDKILRGYSLALFLPVFFRYCFLDDYRLLSGGVNWLFVCVEVSLVYVWYFAYRLLEGEGRAVAYERIVRKAIFAAATILLVYSAFRYLAHSWISLGLGVIGVALFLTGFLVKDKIFRIGGFAVFGITLARILFVDLSMLSMVYKIISFIILGVLFLGISFLYSKYSKPAEKNE